jgi:5'-deoxynucleotidase YfbR-like HD superfamily hydrolase
MMLAVHELEEIIIGDLTYLQITSDEKKKIGHEAIEKVLSDLLTGDEIKQLILEFDEKKTKEALFAYHCDKLECDLQCKIYDEENCVDLNNQSDNKTFYDEKVQELFKTETSWSSMWLEHDRDKFIKDKNFESVLEYIKNNEITKK